MKKLYLSGWHIYANLSGVSGVDLYDYDTINYSYITIKFKDGSVYSYTSDDNSINMIRAMATLAIIGIDFSGYNAKLDEVRLDCTYKQKEPLKSKKKPVFGQSIVIGIQAGYGVGLQPFRAEPYIGIGVTYGFGITW